MKILMNNGVLVMKASKFIPAIGNRLAIKPEHVDAKGGAEKFVPGLGMTFKLKVSPDGEAHKYIPGLGRLFFVRPEHTEA